MATPASPESARAYEAWAVTDFPLLKDDGTKFVVIREGGGRESLLPRSLFTPTRYDLQDPTEAAMSIQDAWGGTNVHVQSVLESYHGDDGLRIATAILPELMLVAAYDHHANLAFAAGRIMIGNGVEHKTVLSIWDNGQSYKSYHALERSYMADASGDLLEQSLLRTPHSKARALPTYAVENAVDGFGGTMTIFSGPIRMDINKEGDVCVPRNTKTRAIKGNLVVVTLPHLAD